MSSLRSLFVVGLLFAGIGITGCASEDDSDPASEEPAVQTQDREEEASPVKVEDTKLDIQKKREALAPKK